MQFSALEIKLKQEHAALIALKQQEADSATFAISMKAKKAEDEGEERKKDVHALNVKNNDKDKQLNVQITENTKLKADADKQKTVMS